MKKLDAVAATEDGLQEGTLDEDKKVVHTIVKRDLEAATRSILASKLRKAGHVSFYGCPTCRQSRLGCIRRNCKPYTFQAHQAKFPESAKRIARHG